jgi:alanine-alpha-ketoisovalerate/valine-pyruvate aminotransferase
MDYNGPGIFQFATNFRVASQRCMIPKELPSGKIEILLIPAVILQAFSIELILKALILQNGSTARGHKLFDLFQMLKVEEKKKIISSMCVPENLFYEKLKMASEAFVKWRYMYENSGLTEDISFLDNFSTQVYLLAKELFKQ